MKRPVYVLGINAYHGDASAALLRDGTLVAAVAEERLRRIKHWAGFPSLAIRSVLSEAGIDGCDVAHVAIARDPTAHLARKVGFVVRHRPSISLLLNRSRHAQAIRDIRGPLSTVLGVSPDKLPRIWGVEHHRAHLSSAFFASSFESAACCAIDGFGDFVSTSTGIGHEHTLDIDRRVYFPHSLGVLYTAITQYLGFPGYGDEWKVMALAAYGGTSLVSVLRRLITLESGGGFRLDLTFFRHWSEGARMEWAEGYPTLDPLYTPALESLLGQPRRDGEAITRRHQDIAAALQLVFEESLWHILGALWERTHEPQLCLAGGCALNAVANGQIRRHTPFRGVFVPPAAGDDGTAVGAALDLWHRSLGGVQRSELPHAYYGPTRVGILDGASAGYAVQETASVEDAAAIAAEVLADGGIVGWYHGRSEWGARALGNRSLLADPRDDRMRQRVNETIKGREPFRPLSPSVLWEAYDDYFEGVPDPFMTQVATVRAERRAVIPAVTHVDGTARVHAVRRETNPAFYRLIEAFGERTGVPVLLNTSFNEKEPIVDTPQQALACFERTGIDALVIERYVIRKGRGSLPAQKTPTASSSYLPFCGTYV